MKVAFAFCCFIAILTACASTTTTPPTTTVTFSSIPTKLPIVLPTKTLTEESIQLSHPTSTPTPTPTPLPVASLAEKGLLLIWDNHAKQYEVLDLSTRSSPRIIRWNSECEWNLLPRATATTCKHPSGQWYLFDILKGTTQDLPIWDTRLIGRDPNGRFLVFTYEAEDNLDIFSYDITTNVTQTLALGIKRQEQERWLMQPVLSADGQQLIVARSIPNHQDTSVFEISQRGAEFQQIGLTEPPATWDLAWSPATNQFVYGQYLRQLWTGGRMKNGMNRA